MGTECTIFYSGEWLGTSGEEDWRLDIDAVNGTLQVTFTGAVAGALQAGDADMDLDFDQLDLVKVQIAAK